MSEFDKAYESWGPDYETAKKAGRVLIMDTDQEKKPALAHEFLKRAESEMQDRSKTYDKPEGERSMSATVKAFEAVTGVSMTDQQGWQFMELLEMVRSNQGDYRADSFVDGAAYAALAGEAASRG